MEAKEAITKAKNYIADVYEDEGIFNIGLEEIEFSDDAWSVTIGFSRQWDKPPRSPFTTTIAPAADYRANSRSYKVIKIRDKDGSIISLRNRPDPL